MFFFFSGPWGFIKFTHDLDLFLVGDIFQFVTMVNHHDEPYDLVEYFLFPSILSTS